MSESRVPAPRPVLPADAEPLPDATVLALHRDVVAFPSVTGTEGALCGHLCERLAAWGAHVRRVGDSLYAVAGSRGPLLCWNTHLDTVPPNPGWTHDPHAVAVIPDAHGRRVVGLGSNDAKASLVAMLAAFVRLLRPLQMDALPYPLRLALLLGAAEETTGAGTREGLAALVAEGLRPDAVLVGEPTELQPALAQKGQLLVELHTTGTPCHAAHAAALGATNAVRRVVADLAAIEALPATAWGPADPWLGATTCEPTLLAGGSASNVVPGSAMATLDVRTAPTRPNAEWLAVIRAAATNSEVRVLADLPAIATDADCAVARAIQTARPDAQPFGSRTMSDMVAFHGIPAVKIGPGRSERSHQPDEFVYEHEVLAGARLYEAVARAYAAELVQRA